MSAIIELKDSSDDLYSKMKTELGKIDFEIVARSVKRLAVVYNSDSRIMQIYERALKAKKEGKIKELQKIAQEYEIPNVDRFLEDNRIKNENYSNEPWKSVDRFLGALISSKKLVAPNAETTADSVLGKVIVVFRDDRSAENSITWHYQRDLQPD